MVSLCKTQTCRLPSPELMNLISARKTPLVCVSHDQWHDLCRSMIDIVEGKIICEE